MQSARVGISRLTVVSVSVSVLTALYPTVAPCEKTTPAFRLRRRPDTSVLYSPWRQTPRTNRATIHLWPSIKPPSTQQHRIQTRPSVSFLYGTDTSFWSTRSCFNKSTVAFPFPTGIGLPYRPLHTPLRSGAQAQDSGTRPTL